MLLRTERRLAKVYILGDNTKTGWVPSEVDCGQGRQGRVMDLALGVVPTEAFLLSWLKSFCISDKTLDWLACLTAEGNLVSEGVKSSISEAMALEEYTVPEPCVESKIKV